MDDLNQPKPKVYYDNRYYRHFIYCSCGKSTEVGYNQDGMPYFLNFEEFGLPQDGWTCGEEGHTLAKEEWLSDFNHPYCRWLRDRDRIYQQGDNDDTS